MTVSSYSEWKIFVAMQCAGLVSLICFSVSLTCQLWQRGRSQALLTTCPLWRIVSVPSPVECRHTLDPLPAAPISAALLRLTPALSMNCSPPSSEASVKINMYLDSNKSTVYKFYSRYMIV